MATPYDAFVDTDLYRVVEKCIADLVGNHDLKECTPRDYIVGYICKQIFAAKLVNRP